MGNVSLAFSNNELHKEGYSFAPEKCRLKKSALLSYMEKLEPTAGFIGKKKYPFWDALVHIKSGVWPDGFKSGAEGMYQKVHSVLVEKLSVPPFYFIVADDAEDAEHAGIDILPVHERNTDHNYTPRRSLIFQTDGMYNSHEHQYLVLMQIANVLITLLFRYRH